MSFQTIAKLLLYFSIISYAFSSSLVDSNKTLQSNDDERVIGGRDALDGERPYQVVLLVNGRFFCGGSLIASDLVLTAAHCIKGAGNDAITIRYNTLSRSVGPTIKVVKNITHQGYSPSTLQNDIGLLKLSTNFISGTNAKIIEIAKPQSFNLRPGSIVTVSGWGKVASNGDVSEKLQVANLAIVQDSVCSREYYPLRITSSMLCAKDQNRSSCNGDSGGPLTVQYNSKTYQVGLVSFGSSRCLDSRASNVFTKVNNYYDWIKQKTSQLNKSKD